MRVSLSLSLARVVVWQLVLVRWLVSAAWDNFPVKSINVDQAWDVDFYTNPFTEQSDLEDPHPVHGIETSDGGFVYVGKGISANKMEGFALKISNNGQKEWLWTSGVSGHDAINAVVELPGGGVLVAGWRTVSGVGKRSLTKLALLNGNEAWTTTNFGDQSSNGAWEMIDLNAAKDKVLLAGLHKKPTLDEMAFKSYGNAEGGSAIVMSAPLTKLTQSLSASDCKTVFDSTGTFGPNTAKAARGMSNGDTAILTWGEEGNGASVLVVDSAGTIRWGPTMFEDKHGEGTDLVVTGDGDLALSGHGDAGVQGEYNGRLTMIASDGQWKWSKSYSAGGNKQVIYNECWGLQALANGGVVLSCGTGIENCEVAGLQGQMLTDCKANQPITADPRAGAVARRAGVWQSLTVMIDKNGDVQWQRVDQFRAKGSPQLGDNAWEERSSASEYVTVCANGDLVFIQDEVSGVGIMKLLKPTDTNSECSLSCSDEFVKGCVPFQCNKLGTAQAAYDQCTSERKQSNGLQGKCLDAGCTDTAAMAASKTMECGEGNNDGGGDTNNNNSGQTGDGGGDTCFCDGVACSAGDANSRCFSTWNIPTSGQKLPVLVSIDGYAVGGPVGFNTKDAAEYYGFAVIKLYGTVKDGAGGFAMEFGNNGIANDCKPMSCEDQDSRDIPFIRRMFQYIQENSYLDETRVFTEGFSQSSMFAVYIAVCFAESVAGTWQGGSGLAKTGYVPVTPGKQAQCSQTSFATHGSECCAQEFCSDCQFWPLYPKTGTNKLVDCLMAYTDDTLACGTDLYMFEAMVAEGNDARLLSFPGGKHSNPENSLSWIVGCLGLAPACSSTCEANFASCVATSTASTAPAKFAECEGIIKAGGLQGCDIGCAPTLAMLLHSEEAEITLSEGRFGTQTGLDKSTTAPAPKCTAPFGKFAEVNENSCVPANGKLDYNKPTCAGTSGDTSGDTSGGTSGDPGSSCVDDPAFVWAGKYTCSDYSGTAFKFCTLEQADEGCPLTCKKCTTLDDPCEDSSTWEDKFGTPCSGYALDAVNSKHAQCGSDPKAAFHCPRSCGKCTFSKDCVLGPALETSDCTSNCGTVTQSVGEPAVGSGQCNPSTYSCQAGDGQCPGGEYADEANNCGDPSQGLSPVDCTINNDYGSYCVYGNHCACGEGFECETPGGIVDNECAPGSTCITPKDCEDDPNFLGKGEYTCSSYSGENSYKYCTPEGADEACPNTCKKCTTLDDPCEDSSTWKDSAGTKCDGYAVNAASSKHSQCTSAGAVYPCPRACGKCTSSCATHTCTAGTKKDNPGQIIVISSSDELCCNPPVEPEPEPEPEEGGFDFGTGCPGGSGEFIFNLPIKRTYLDVPGVIPEGKYGVDIRLEATADLDVTLVDIAYKGEQNQYLDGYNIVAFGDNSHAGLLNGANTETKVYSRPGIEPMSVTYSGYNGVAVNGVQNLGNEFIKVNSVTSAELKMRGFAYQTGEAKILYSWSRSQTKCCLGEELCVGDQFQKLIKEKDVITVGEIPAGKIDVHIVLDSDKDVDVQLFDKSTQTKIIGFWTEATGEGLLHGADQESAVYEGLTYTYSGYNGVMDNGQQKLGKEFIKITGTTNRAVIMKAYGYKEGNALIDYTYLEPRPVRSTSRGRAGPTSSHASRSANQQRRAGQREPRSQPQSRPRLRPRP